MEKIERFCWLLRVFVEDSTELGSIVDKISRALNCQIFVLPKL
ncbi:hypothetical protein [Palaeococcus sp. (in: euryarchaeotes)]